MMNWSRRMGWLSATMTLVKRGNEKRSLFGKLGPMLRHENVSSVTWELDGRSRDMPGFTINDRIIWGITFRMLNRLLSVIYPDFTPLV